MKLNSIGLDNLFGYFWAKPVCTNDFRFFLLEIEIGSTRSHSVGRKRLLTCRKTYYKVNE
jgi:hypothetical protein